jgi:hypothetical protein
MEVRQATDVGKPRSGRLLRTRSDKIAALAIILALGSACYGTFVSRRIYVKLLPGISLATPSTSPDVVFFSIKNNSRFLKFKKLQWLCAVDYAAELRLGSDIGDVPPETMGPKVTLAPSASMTASCPIGKPASLGPRVALLVRYEFLWFKVGFQVTRLKWSAHAVPPQWIEDEFAPEAVALRDYRRPAASEAEGCGTYGTGDRAGASCGPSKP